MDRISRWLGAAPHRAGIVNVVMLSAILALAGSDRLYLLVGGGTVALAGGFFAVCALRHSLLGRADLYRLVLTWIPGVLATALAAAALFLITSRPSGDLGHIVGMVLFVAEAGFLTMAAADLGARLPQGAN